jgi:hypothetical protein
MIKIIYFLLFISAFNNIIFSQEADTVYRDGEQKIYLRNDDPLYNEKSSVLTPLFGVVRSNISTWILDRYILNEPWARIGFNSMRENLKSQWVWDTDNFNMNFFLHPYAGSMYFNSPRSNGFNFYESAPFVVFGSLMWEYLMENTPPSKNDLINTTISGIFLGEVLYRISSNILNDSKKGSQRFWREFFAGIVNPTRASNRFFQGKMTRYVDKEIYQKEPMDVSLSVGVHRLNEELDFNKGNVSGLIMADLVYGDPYQKRSRKPFDYFKLDFGINFLQGGLQNVGQNLLEHTTGNALITGGSSKHGRLEMLTGLFQHYDYWSTRHFEIGTLGFGGGLLFQIPHSKTFRFESSVHLSAVPFGGSNSHYVTVGERDYNFAGGLEAKTENTLYLGIASLSLAYHYFWLHTFVGEKGNNLLGILIPKVTVKLFKKFGIGAEYLLFHKDSFLRDFPNVHTRNTELRFYLTISSGYFDF